LVAANEPQSTNGTFPLRVEHVLEVVAEAYGIDVKTLRAPGRKSPAKEARLVAYVLVHDECHRSWAHVAEVLGRYYNSSNVRAAARNANPAAVAELRARLRPESAQPTLWAES
jgi:chromosomal replication initiation ATPase DnaA